MENILIWILFWTILLIDQFKIYNIYIILQEILYVWNHFNIMGKNSDLLIPVIENVDNMITNLEKNKGIISDNSNFIFSSVCFDKIYLYKTKYFSYFSLSILLEVENCNDDLSLCYLLKGVCCKQLQQYEDAERYLKIVINRYSL